MKNITNSALNKIINELNDKYIGTHISNVFTLNSKDIVLAFSYSNLDKVFISLDHCSPFISPFNNEVAFINQSGKLSETLRKLIKNTIVKNTTILNGDKIVKISLEKCDDFYEIQHFSLIIELIPHHPNLLFLDSEDKIVFACHYTNLDSKRIILKNIKYIVPDKSCLANNEEDFDYRIEANKRLDYALDLANKEKYKNLITFINRQLNIKEKKIILLEQEVKEKQNYTQLIEQANMIMTYLNDDNFLNDYITSNKIKIDESKSFVENANNMYKKAKKYKNAIEINKQQISIARDEIVSLKRDLDIIASNDDQLIYSLSTTYPRFFKYIKPIKKSAKSNLPYYVIINNTKIGFGKNKQQNDYLTFKIANKTNTFLHIKDGHGGHVVIFKENPSYEDLNNASQIALLISKKDIGTINYTLVKNVKKTRSIGLVILSEYKTIVIKKIDEFVKINYQKALRFL